MQPKNTSTYGKGESMRVSKQKKTLKPSKPFPKIIIEGFSTREALKLMNILPKVIKVLGVSEPLTIKKSSTCFHLRIDRTFWKRRTGMTWEIPNAFFVDKEGRDKRDSSLGYLMVVLVLHCLEISLDNDDLWKYWTEGKANAYQI